jgi:hypothetical protein
MVPIVEKIKMGFRPYLSDKRPSNGALTSWMPTKMPIPNDINKGPCEDDFKNSGQAGHTAAPAITSIKIMV